MSLLSIMTAFAGRTGWVVPVTVATSSDTQLRKALGLLNELVDELVNSTYTYTFLIREATFTSVDGASQGYLSDLAPAGYKSMIPGTFFDRSQNLEIKGPISSAEWQRRQSMGISGTCYEFREWLGQIWLSPDAEAGSSMAFEYRSKYAIMDEVTDAPDVIYKNWFTLDTDTSTIPEDLLLIGLRYKWREDNGFDATNLKNSFESMLASFQVQEGNRKPVSMRGAKAGSGTGIVIPFGSYNQ